MTKQIILIVIHLKVNKSKSPNGVNTGDLVTIGRSPPESTSRDIEVPRINDGSRVTQLEQNIRFLQEQHQTMLTGLHREIDNLRHCNRGTLIKNQIKSPCN